MRILTTTAPAVRWLGNKTACMRTFHYTTQAYGTEGARGAATGLDIRPVVIQESEILLASAYSRAGAKKTRVLNTTVRLRGPVGVVCACVQI